MTPTDGVPLADPLDTIAVTLADRYRIEVGPDGRPTLLGQGGMAFVYLAFDLKHQRQVAIKVLRPELAVTLGGERFLREIQIAARLRHPHIVPVYDSGAVAGQFYYVMPQIEGESLRTRLTRDKRLPLDEALRITSEVADALAYAHAHDVVHRDIKPENILLDSGHAAVADFGIARAVTAAGDPNITETGFTLGTPTYMSPEQAVGDRTVDGRTDQYALATVLYEMLVGSPPFTGPTAQAVITRRLTETPPPLREGRSETPAGVERAVRQALGRTPEERFTDMSLFGAALRTPPGNLAGTLVSRRGRWTKIVFAMAATSAVVAAVLLSLLRSPSKARSIAVLPMENVGGDSGNQYFADGLTDELTHALSKIPGLKVASRTSAFRFKGRPIEPREIGQQLGVATLLNATVQRAEGRLRIVAQLTNAADGLLLWSETYKTGVQDIFRVQEELATSIANALKLTLGAPQVRAVSRRGTENVEAYDLYLNGRYFWNQLTTPALAKAAQFFEQAVAKDSSFARAYTGVSDTYFLLGAIGTAPPDSLYPKAKAMALKALSLDSTLAEAHTSLGMVNLFYDWDWASADRELSRGVALDPRYAEARLFHAWYYTVVGRFPEALREIEEAARLEPLSSRIQVRVATMLHYAGQYDRAVTQVRKVLQLDSTTYWAIGQLSREYVQKNMNDSAIAWARKLVGDNRNYEVADLGVALASAGRRAEALQAIADLREAKDRYTHPDVFAMIYAALGERDSAFKYLDRAFAAHAWSVILLRWEPIYNGLHSDPRWEALVRRLKFP